MSDIERLRAVAQVLPDEYIDHGGNCAGTLCDGCGHCIHSIEACGHDCDSSGGGCRDAIDTSEVTFRRDVLALLDRLGAAEAKVARVSAAAQAMIDVYDDVAPDWWPAAMDDLRAALSEESQP